MIGEDEVEMVCRGGGKRRGRWDDVKKKKKNKRAMREMKELLCVGYLTHLVIRDGA